MARPEISALGLARIGLELMLGTLAMWLVVQNALLLLLNPWKTAPDLLVAAQALAKVAGALAITLVPWLALASLVAGVVTVWLLRERPARRSGEVQHG